MAYKFDNKLHAHTLDGRALYGTSTIVKDVMPPFLAKWGAECAIRYIKENALPTQAGDLGETILTNNEILDKSVSAWVNERNTAADKGTDMHAELEEYVKDCIKEGGSPIKKDGDTPVALFADWAIENVDTFIFAEKNTYSKELWVGGVVDCVAKLKSGKIAVIDFKSSKAAYFNHFVQVAGYALQLEESGYGDFSGDNWQTLDDKVGELIIIPFGAKKFKPEKVENVDGLKDVFRSVLNVYVFLQAFNKK